MARRFERSLRHQYKMAGLKLSSNRSEVCCRPVTDGQVSDRTVNRRIENFDRNLNYRRPLQAANLRISDFDGHPRWIDGPKPRSVRKTSASK